MRIVHSTTLRWAHVANQGRLTRWVNFAVLMLLFGLVAGGCNLLLSDEPEADVEIDTADAFDGDTDQGDTDDAGPTDTGPDVSDAADTTDTSDAMDTARDDTDPSDAPDVDTTDIDASDTDVAEVNAPENTRAACTDELDNDGDGLTDCVDDDCAVVCFCPSNQNVVSGACVTCPAGSTNASGDSIGGPDTDCDPVLCAEDEYVESNVCVSCEVDAFNQAGDDASSDDTDCDQDTCSLALGVSCDAFNDAYIKASNTRVRDSFGFAIALSQDGLTLAVGAFGEDSASTGVDGDDSDDSASAAGAVYVFTRDDLGWTQQAYLKASNASAGDQFGYSVALSADGSTLAVGANGEAGGLSGVDADQADDTAQGAGAVYVFVRNGSNVWRQEAYIKASNPDAGDEFGTRVALTADGQTLAVSAIGESSNSEGLGGVEEDNEAADSGAVYMFERADIIGWVQTTYIKARNADAGDLFGYSLALSGDGSTMVVGAVGEASIGDQINGNYPNNTSVDSGAAYIFNRTDDGWEHFAYVKVTNSQTGDRFGQSVSLSYDGSTLAIGADLEASAATGVDGDMADNEAAGAGAVYIFLRGTNERWTQVAYLKASNTDAHDGFGSSVALSADGMALVVGAVGESSAATNVNRSQTDNTIESAGAVYLFTRVVDTWSQHAYIKASNSGWMDGFGEQVALSADGSVLAVGASEEDGNATGVNGEENINAQNGSGAVYVRRLGDGF